MDKVPFRVSVEQTLDIQDFCTAVTVSDNGPPIEVRVAEKLKFDSETEWSQQMILKHENDLRGPDFPLINKYFPKHSSDAQCR